MLWGAIAGGAVGAAMAGLAARYAAQRRRIERSWLSSVAPKHTMWVGEELVVSAAGSMLKPAARVRPRA
jgi:hypothetical protein